MRDNLRITRESQGGRNRRIVNRPVSNDTRNKNNNEETKIQMSNFSENVNTYFHFLNEQNTKDEESPFYVTLPPINDGSNINVLSEVKKHEVLSLYQEKSIDRISEEYDIVTIIPFRNRYFHLEKTLEYLEQSRLNSYYKIGIVIIENSSAPIAKEIAEKYNCHYRWIDSKNKIFNKCISHNIGAYITNSKLIHFHDCDLIVPSNFYNKFLDELRTKDALQCFTKRRVNYLHEYQSKKIFNGENLETFVGDVINYRIGNYGAPGGSIALSRDLFEKIGGFDAHLFWSYSIEDAFFWKKMEIHYPVSETDIELYHLWHPPSHGKNPHERFEKKYYDIFCRMPDKNSYIDVAKRIYKETMEYLVK